MEEKMKKQLIGLATIALMFNLGGSANATLNFITTDVLLETETDLYWYRDLTHWVDKTYDEQQDAINLLETLDPIQSDWRMANYTEMESLFLNEITSLLTGFQPTYIRDSDSTFWHGRYDQEATSDHPAIGYDPNVSQHLDGEMGQISNLPSFTRLHGTVIFSDMLRNSGIGAWVVADATPTPEPTTMLIFGTGLAGLVGSRIRKKKK